MNYSISYSFARKPSSILYRSSLPALLVPEKGITSKLTSWLTVLFSLIVLRIMAVCLAIWLLFILSDFVAMM